MNDTGLKAVSIEKKPYTRSYIDTKPGREWIPGLRALTIHGRRDEHGAAELIFPQLVVLHMLHSLFLPLGFIRYGR